MNSIKYHFGASFTTSFDPQFCNERTTIIRIAQKRVSNIRVFLLTNTHVLRACARASRGTRELASGTVLADVPTDGDCVAICEVECLCARIFHPHCHAASLSRGGHLACLKYARENGCPCNVGVYTAAAEEGYLECLKYLHENECP